MILILRTCIAAVVSAVSRYIYWTLKISVLFIFLKVYPIGSDKCDSHIICIAHSVIHLLQRECLIAWIVVCNLSNTPVQMCLLCTAEWKCTEPWSPNLVCNERIHIQVVNALNLPHVLQLPAILVAVRLIRADCAVWHQVRMSHWKEGGTKIGPQKEEPTYLATMSAGTTPPYSSYAPVKLSSPGGTLNFNGTHTGVEPGNWHVSPALPSGYAT